MFFTTLVFVFGLAGIYGPIDVPDGKGNYLVYDYTSSKDDCRGHKIVTPDGKGDYIYFCQVN